MSKTCHNCNNTFDDNYNICPRCGMQYIAPDQSMSGRFEQPDMPAGRSAAPVGQPVGQSMTLWQWVGTILLTTCFGIVSLVLLFVWGFSNTTPEAKKNYCRAMLIVMAIGYVISLIALIVLASLIASHADEFSTFFDELIKALDGMEASNLPTL